MVVLEIIVYTVAVHRRILVDEAAVQRSHRHGRLEGGAGRVQTLQCPVEQGQAWVRAVFAVVGCIKVLVVAGVIGRRQHAAILHVDDHRSSSSGLHIAGVVDTVDHIDIVGQRLVHRTLEVAVNGQLHRMARLRGGGHLGIHDDAVRIAGDGLHTVLAAQLVLISGFQTRNAQNIVHVVAFFPQRIGSLAVFIGDFPFFCRDLAHAAQYRRNDIALFIAAGAGLHDLHAGQLQAVLLDGGNGHATDIFRHDKVVHIGECLTVHLIVDARQHTLP